jgi:hypothetical protein
VGRGHRPKPSFDPQLAFLYTLIGVTILLLGGGPLSLDSWLQAKGDYNKIKTSSQTSSKSFSFAKAATMPPKNTSIQYEEEADRRTVPVKLPPRVMAELKRV